jgi:hypothetical protein
VGNRTLTLTRVVLAIAVVLLAVVAARADSPLWFGLVVFGIVTASGIEWVVRWRRRSN